MWLNYRMYIDIDINTYHIRIKSNKMSLRQTILFQLAFDFDIFKILSI